MVYNPPFLHTKKHLALIYFLSDKNQDKPEIEDKPTTELAVPQKDEKSTFFWGRK